LGQPPIPFHTQDPSKVTTGESHGNINCTDLESSTMVSDTPVFVHSHASVNPESDQVVHSGPIGQGGATQEQNVEYSSIQSVWRQHTQDWSSEAQSLAMQGLKPSTLANYNAYVRRFQDFCKERNVPFKFH
jgi:hypothetical protein